MALSDDKKKDMLLQSFNVLKNNMEANSEKIKELIAKVAKFDKQTAIEMWEYVLDKGKHLVRDPRNAYSFCGGLVYEMEKNIGENAVIDIIENNDIIRKKIYGQSGDICCSTYFSGKKFIEKNNIELANEIINYIYENKYKQQKFGEILEELCSFDANEDKLTPEAVEMLVSWLDKVNDDEGKARITVSLADHM